MKVLAMLTVATLALAMLFVSGIFMGLRRASRTQRIAFYSGLSGLVAMPFWFIGFAGLMAQLILATLNSVAGYLVIAASTMLLGAVVGVLYSTIVIWRSAGTR